MAVPDELDSYTLDELYVIPEQFAAAAEPFEEIPSAQAYRGRRPRRRDHSEPHDRSWIVLDATPGQVWPLVRDYWAQLQVILEYENPGEGIMETSWLEVDSNLETRHKYRVSIEPGLHSGYSEIYVVHTAEPQE